jgi:uncharacterized protein YeaO (DUF488 family)
MLHIRTARSPAEGPPVARRPRLAVKRAYEAPAKDDGCRVLVDRVWPRGITKEALQVDDWLKELAPSTDLRKWFGHDPAKWGAFKARYFHELEGRRDLIERLLALPAGRRLTLVYGAKDSEYNNAVALKAYLEQRRCRKATSGDARKR